MPKNNSDFFKEKKIWSEVKDELLGCYLKPYLSKVMFMRKPILYVDCFAGKGMFDDGKKGSPLIAAECIQQCIDGFEKSNYGAPAPPIWSCFIESTHADDLQHYLEQQPYKAFRVKRGKFEDHILEVLERVRRNHTDANVFLYVDPYGVKVLNAALFAQLPDVFATAELLINFNSFGFIREGCRVLKVDFRESETDVLADLVEYDSSKVQSIKELSDAVGGDYWQRVILDYKEGLYDCYEAEKRLSELYKEKLREKYKYVLDMPIRLKAENHPKYRMVHATNHPDGCWLMADNMAKRTDHLIIDIQNQGQTTFFNRAENQYISDEELYDLMVQLLTESPDRRRLNEVLADFFNKYGVLCEPRVLSSRQSGSVLKQLEREGKIVVQRFERDIETKKQFWSESKGKKIFIQWR